MGKITIFLIRHGESVDNVAGLLAGVRDSPLTSHGAIQARRLGAHLTSTRFDWIFVSNLQRAVSTAEAVRDAQTETKPTLVQVPDLREKDFGSDEGRRWDKQVAAAQDAETKQSMRQRSARFIDEHLSPIVVSSADGEDDTNIAIVSHGMMLASLLAVVRGPDCFHPSLVSSLNADVPARWSNTGFTRLEVSFVEAPTSSEAHPRWPHCRLAVATVNSVAHLAGLKKTRGGIGSAQHDARQRTVTSFFASGPSKKRKAEEQLD
ncbi:phosphoglycerate mutase family protein [Plectosphaerella plurivora]|uniref:Phosphoglycerate mutase family protein n=1 Tax=Plectosphaerella plurivora TaxID=936078 RepID=A0A9P8VMY8_9PEZI|nr:phosphoglycerate mutase family protein [Plectosphaerella plurivora]